MGLKVLYIFSHDLLVQEDGPTHQPIEQLAGLRAIPNLNVFRPADINETLEFEQPKRKHSKCHCFIENKGSYINPGYSKENKCEKGAYTVNLT